MRTRAKGSGAEGEERPAYEYYLKEKKDPPYFRQELFQTKGDEIDSSEFHDGGGAFKFAHRGLERRFSFTSHGIGAKKKKI